MTFSIVACDPSVPEWGVAVASKFPAVGAVVPWARAGAGAVATQPYANVSLGPRGLDLMAGGASAEEALDRMLGEDEGRPSRQIGAIDARGNPATFTGDECMAWAGGRTGSGSRARGTSWSGRRWWTGW